MQVHQITVLCAGIVGACCTFKLQERSYRIELVNRSEAEEETSSGNAGELSLGSIAPPASTK